jgi:hypothetical protein
MGGVPVANARRQTAPLAAVLCDVQDRVERVQVGEIDVAALGWQVVLDLLEPSWCDLDSDAVAPLW